MRSAQKTNMLVHQGALGDWVLTFPLLRGLAATGPTLAVTAGSKAKLAARLLPGAGVESVDIERPEFSRLHVDAGESPTLARAEGIIISFVSTGEDAWARNARRIAPRAKLAFASTRPPAGYARHVCDWHAEQLQAQGIELPGVPIARRENPGGPIVIHPGSGGAAKCWPVERFEASIERLRGQGCEVRPLLGEVEMERWPAAVRERWITRLGARVIESLDALCDELEAASLFVGNDSGPTHLAAQMGVRTVALFGPSDPRVWAPRGPAARVLAPESPRGMEWLSVEEVLGVV